MVAGLRAVTLLLIFARQEAHQDILLLSSLYWRLPAWKHVPRPAQRIDLPGQSSRRRPSNHSRGSLTSWSKPNADTSDSIVARYDMPHLSAGGLVCVRRVRLSLGPWPGPLTLLRFFSSPLHCTVRHGTRNTRKLEARARVALATYHPGCILQYANMRREHRSRCFLATYYRAGRAYS